MNEFPLFSFGSDELPGLAKIIEECGEFLTIAGKFVMTGGVSPHFDGRNLYEELQAEGTDLYAALTFFFENAMPLDEARFQRKMGYFNMWASEPHEEFATRLAEHNTTHESTTARLNAREGKDGIGSSTGQ